MQKKYIIGLVIAIIGSVLYMINRQSKQVEDLQVYQKKTFSKLVDIAQKSPRGGLAQMGRALKKYHQVNKVYPQALIALYPDYIPDKDFIEEIAWEYKNRGADFYLSKTVNVHNVVMVAVIDKQLIPIVTSDGTMVATKGKKVADTQESEVDKTVTREEMLARFKILDEFKDDFIKEEPKEEVPGDPRIVEVLNAELGLGLPSEISKQYFVWKDSRGNIGFGDTKYQILKNYLFYDNNSWIRVKIPQLAEPVQALFPDAGKKAESETRIAKKYSDMFLVWRDRLGHKGFSNLNYPVSKKLSGFKGESWLEFDNSVDIPPVEKENQLGFKITRESIASEAREMKYLVWRNASGNIGFGNIEFPSESGAKFSVFDKNQKEWFQVKSESRRKVPKEEQSKQLNREMRSDDILKQLSQVFLVYKDKGGNKAFSNMTYPEDLSYVCVNGAWRKMAATSQ